MIQRTLTCSLSLILAFSVLAYAVVETLQSPGRVAALSKAPDALLANNATAPEQAVVPLVTSANWIASGKREIADVLASAVRVAPGEAFTCAVTSVGGTKCWGYNGSGQLGDGTTTGSTTPVDVSGLASGMVAVSAGQSHACGLTSSGGVKCWGANWNGQLGNGTTTSSATPVDVSGLASGVVAVSAGQSHACAVTSVGGTKCWGYNGSGQLGDGTTTGSTTPVDVSGLASGAVAVAAGRDHTCAVTSGGGVMCWGHNGFGKLGDGTYETRTAPVAVSGLGGGAIAIAAGRDHTCALLTAGEVKCWGYNGYGQLGDGTYESYATPVDVSGLGGGATAVTAGDHSCALLTEGGLKCWGLNNYGQVGDGTWTNRATPVAVSGLASEVVVVAANIYNTCAVTSAGAIKCWGRNYSGELGNGRTTNQSTPVAVTGLASGVSTVAAGSGYTCVAMGAGGGRCWGRNDYGQLGDDTMTSRYAPMAVSGLASVVAAVTAGGTAASGPPVGHTCALMSGGGIKCWGANGYGQLGDGTTDNRLTPVDVTGLASGVVAVAAGGFHACALLDGGGLRCWGLNAYGQLGDGTSTNRFAPVDVSGVASGVLAVAAGRDHTCAIMSGGAVKCWGRNNSGQLGDGTTTTRLKPVDVSGLSSGAAAVAAGREHTCVVGSEGGMKCWGANSYGQLGDGTTTGSSVPVDVSGLGSGAATVSAGGYHTCAITSEDGIQCWGSNDAGQLGDGTRVNRSAPITVSGLGTGVEVVAAGYNHTCALTSGGGVKCWGSNVYAQLGVNPGWTPVDVVGFEGEPLRVMIWLPAVIAPARD